MSLNNQRPLFIFCGGDSRRIGQNKALLTIHGSTFLAHLAERAGSYFSKVALLSNHHSYEMNLPGYPDSGEGNGPLSGLLTALKQSSAPVIATVTVDSPLISSRLLHRLATMDLSEKADAAVVESSDSLYPLTGLFRTDLAERLGRQLAQNNCKVIDFLKNCHVESIPCKDEEIMNINTMNDYNLWLSEDG